MREISIVKQNILQFLDFKGISKYEFYQKTGISNGILSQSNGISEDNILKFLSYYSEINTSWLFTGKGSMLKGDLPIEKDFKGIPLIPIEAMAGYGNGSIQVMEYETEHFMVPTFKGADYLIGVRGSSMYPKYNSGDIVACKHLAIDTFFQWNKVYVLDTIQGALIKRVCKGSDDNHVLIVSDNSKYDSFELHRSEIHAIAIVMGVIRLE